MLNAASMLGVFEKLQSIDITVQQNRCAIVRNRNASCMKCAEACTSGAISYKNGELIISPDLCIGCGTCATACPTCALEAHHPNDRELYEACICAMKNSDGTVTIACENLLQAAEGYYDPDKVVGVKCLGRIEESLIVLLARAKAKRIVLVQGECTGCKLNPGSTMAQQVCATANSLLCAWGQNDIVTISTKLPGCTRKRSDKTYDAKRRGFLTEMFETSKSVARTTVDYAIEDALGENDETPPEPVIQKVQDDGTLPHFLPHRRGRLIKALASFGEPNDVLVETRLWGHVIIDSDLCTSCQMCAVFCPTEAIKKFEDKDGSFGIDHYPSRCVKCRCCTDICSANALTLSDEVFAQDLADGSYERYEMKPRDVTLGPHQMMGSIKKLIDDEFIYER